MLELFLLRDGAATPLLLGSYDPWLVALSLLIAVFSSSMALQVAGLARIAHSAAMRQTALLSGSLALSGGIWAMHFIGMLAFEICTIVSYDGRLTLLSMLPAMLASWVALNLIAHRDINRWQLIIGGILVGAGIGTMHYSGMAAMQMSPLLRYDPLWFAASLLVAVALAILSLWIRFGLRRSGRFKVNQAILLGGLVMGLAIAGMHYTGMAAARFIGTPQADYQPGMNSNALLAVAVGLITVSSSVFVLAGNAFLRYRHLYTQKLDSENRLRAIVNTAVDGIITINHQGIIQSLNHSAERLFGWRESELVGLNIKRLMPEPYRANHDGYLANYLKTGEAKIIGQGREVTAMRRDGSLLPVRLAVGRAETPGQPVFVGFLTDISEHKAMERELRAREAQYRTLIGNIPGVTFRSRVDHDWSKLFVSDAVETLIGWDKGDFLDGRLSFADIIHPDDLERVRTEVEQALAARRPYVLEYRLRHRDGGERWVSESASGVYDEEGKVQWIDGVIIDVTRSKLRNAEFEGIVQAMRQAMAVVEFDLDGTILDANDNFLRLSGYRLDELRGQHHRRLCLPDEVASADYQAFWTTLRHGEFLQGEYCRLAKDGHRFWIHASYNPILDADGKPWKIVKLASDLSERKAMEHDLLLARDKAEQAASAKGMFLANMSHEIRTPMNAIIGFTELLLSGRLEGEQRRHLGTVRQSARSLLGLLNDILDTAKLERGAIELDCDDFSLRELGQQVLAALQLQADQKGLALHLDYPADLAEHYHGDAMRVRQVLTNLLGNAVKFTERGSVTLQVRQQQGRLQLNVIDTGIGIAPERLPHIFAPFTQADASMARRFGGTGLGTTIARQLVELMGGHIEASSEQGAGSCFSVTLPLPEAQGSSHIAPATPLQLPALHILVADDVPQNLELLQLALSRDGHRVSTARNGEEACEQYRQQHVDVVLMDVQMPVLDGLQATRRIRQLERQLQRPAVPVIALTASVLEKDRSEAGAAGMNGFASKPVDMPQLYAEIARVLQGCATAQSLPAAAPAAPALADIDWHGASLRWGSREQLLPHLQRFVTEYADLADSLQQAPASALSALAHRARGAAANLGLLRLAAVLAEIEHDDNLTPARLSALHLALADACAAVAGKQAATVPAGATTPVPERELRPLLQTLAEACRHGEFDEASLNALAQHLPGALFVPLQQALDSFDFEQALHQLALIEHQLATPTGVAP
ncbi:PAS domain S-box protein [Vogesella sp. LYT5W]|uniref:histidine kinase n=1 Tax=Vogesella margarita TaxID=2984199 RepID=A0ABT5IMB9_9NEIS|nr:PAS domain S-box protein [Vogesella margarita]MDC7713700.1 PAS domain S-box protein [Vogesella margarita]